MLEVEEGFPPIHYTIRDITAALVQRSEQAEMRMCSHGFSVQKGENAIINSVS